jgi:hypothetical protein
MATFSEQMATDMEKTFFSSGDLALPMASVTYRVAATGATSTVSAIFSEFVGALDFFADAIFTIENNATRGIEDPQPGDQLTFNSEVWTVVKIRGDSTSLIHELRCRLPQEIV